MESNPQKAHYEFIHDSYNAHYFDSWSMRFREEFIYFPLFQGLQHSAIRVADIASGSGENSVALKRVRPQATVVGVDISESAVAEYKRKLSADAHILDLTVPMTVEFGTFDAVMVIGGLHHCVNDLKTTFVNISKLLKPGGVLLMYEPNRRFVLERLRRYWYRHDRYFEADSEAALDHDEIADLAANEFEVDWVRYCGGPGYFLVLNSLVLRIPLKANPLISPPLLFAESIWNTIPAPVLQATFLAQWRKRAECL